MDVATQQQRALIELARRDPNRWVEYGFSDKDGTSLAQGEIHREFQEATSIYKHLMVEWPRDHGKTTQAICRALFELGHDRDLNITIVGAVDDRAQKRLGEIAFNAMRNPKVKRVFPDMEVESVSKTKLLLRRPRIARENSVEAYGVLSSGTGDRTDLLIFDDICDRKNSLTQPALRRQVKEAYRDDWMQLLGPDGRSWYLFTPWHREDLSHEMINEGTLPLLQHRVRVDWTSAGEPRRVDPVWPQQWGARELLSRWRKIGTRAFNRAFCGQAVDDTDRTIWPEWFMFGPPPFPLATAVRIQIWDGAAPRKVKSPNPDFMGYIDMYISPAHSKMFIADAWRARGLSPSRQISAVKSRLHFGPQPRYLIIEETAQSALAALVAEAGILKKGTILVPIGTEGKSKELRAEEYLAPLMEMGCVIWSERLNPDLNSQAPPVRDELVDLPFGDHDDLADCAVYGARVAKRLMRFQIPDFKDDVPVVTAEVNLY